MCPDENGIKPERSVESYEAEYTEAMEANADLVDRLRRGDVHALASLIEAVTGSRITASHISAPPRGFV